MKTLKKSTLASLVGAAALATTGAANAAFMVGGEDGYEFSVDGNINNFFVQTDQDSANGAGGQDNSQIANGLLPTFFGLNISAPEVNGLKIGARVSISPSTNNFTGNAGGGAIEQREAFGTVDGSFGQILFGKALGIYSANNILLDQTLFGVGASGVDAAGDQNSGSTTLGRIGWGYDYADWRSQISWTSPDMNGFQAKAGVFDAVDVVGEARADSADSLDEKDPRFEASLSYAGGFDNGTVKLWLDGMTQEVDATINGSSESIKSNAYTVGGQLTFAGFEAVATYYDNKGVGAGGGLEQVIDLTGYSTSAVDVSGDERDGDGYYVQGGYRFAGQTLVSASYGESTLERTSFEKANGLDGVFDSNNMLTIGVYHDVTSNLKLVAEYSQMETEYHSVSGNEDDEVDVFALGGFITW